MTIWNKKLEHWGGEPNLVINALPLKDREKLVYGYGVDEDALWNKLKQHIEIGWLRKLYPFLSSKAGEDMFKKLAAKKSKRIVPNQEDTFRAFKKCSWENFKVAIIGRAPYSQVMEGKPEADGLAFSCKNVTTFNLLPSSTKNIYEELNRSVPGGDWELKVDFSFDHWAEQGILLLNKSLTTDKNCYNQHEDIWNDFYNHVLQVIGDYAPGTIMVFLGDVPYTKDLIRFTNILHFPDPEVCIYNEFKNCDMFNEINKLLYKLNKEEIVW